MISHIIIQKRIERDKFIDEIIDIVGFKVIHIKCSYSYSSQDIKEKIKKRITGLNMQLKGFQAIMLETLILRKITL